jgi:hypothetical protein
MGAVSVLTSGLLLHLHLGFHLGFHLDLRLGFRLGRRLVEHRRGGDRLLVVLLLHALGYLSVEDLFDQISLLGGHLARVLLRALAPANKPNLELPRRLARLL